jgi:hypothetical protein
MLTRTPDILRADLAAQKRRWAEISRQSGLDYYQIIRFARGKFMRPGWDFLMALDRIVPSSAIVESNEEQK